MTLIGLKHNTRRLVCQLTNHDQLLLLHSKAPANNLKVIGLVDMNYNESEYAPHHSTLTDRTSVAFEMIPVDRIEANPVTGSVHQMRPVVHSTSSNQSQMTSDTAISCTDLTRLQYRLHSGRSSLGRFSWRLHEL